jgi:hypothetical protein
MKMLNKFFKKSLRMCSGVNIFVLVEAFLRQIQNKNRYPCTSTKTPKYLNFEYNKDRNLHL